MRTMRIVCGMPAAFGERAHAVRPARSSIASTVPSLSAIQEHHALDGEAVEQAADLPRAALVASRPVAPAGRTAPRRPRPRIARDHLPHVHARPPCASRVVAPVEPAHGWASTRSMRWSVWAPSAVGPCRSSSNQSRAATRLTKHSANAPELRGAHRCDKDRRQRAELEDAVAMARKGGAVDRSCRCSHAAPRSGQLVEDQGRGLGQTRTPSAPAAWAGLLSRMNQLPTIRPM